MFDLPRARIRGAALLAASSLALSSCFVTPGAFTSELVLEDGDRFSFTYEGEIFFLGLSQLAQMAGSQDEEFEPDPCVDENFEQRECTAEELAEQRAEWDAGAADRAEKSAREAEQLARMMGGIDPSDPQANEELRALLLRHRGWNAVEIKGDGLFEVSFAVSGRTTHDFQFPVMEGFDQTNTFVTVHLRDENIVRVNAPGFSSEEGSNPMGEMMGGMAGLAALGKAGEQGDIDLPQIDGTFTIRTDGEILANNTDEGPVRTASGQELRWSITPRTQAMPTALIRMR